MDVYVVGIDIGGTKIATVVAGRDGKILKKIRKPTEAEKGPQHAVQLLREMVDETIQLAGLRRENILGIGVSCGGPLDTKTGIVYSPPNLSGWDAVPLKELIEAEFHVPTIIENDANAGALAEWRFGGGRGYNYVLYMTMSTGIGGGIVVKGQVYHGANNSAGEVGHQILLPDGPRCGCGQRGCLEALASGTAIARRAQAAVQEQPNTKILELTDGQIDRVRSEHVLEAAQDGDPLGMSLIEEAAYYMGWGIANLVNILNPEIVLIGTIAVAGGDLVLDPIRRTAANMAMQRPWEAVRIMPAELGEAVGDLGAISLVLSP